MSGRARPAQWEPNSRTLMSDFELEFVRRNELSHALAMVHCLQDHFLEMRETAEKSLIRNLPKLLPEDRDWVDETAIRAMTEALDFSRSSLTLALLYALGHVGDERAYRKVESFWLQISASDHLYAISLREAAAQCMDQLRAHRLKSTQARTLLRGSEEPPVPVNTILLRPASETSASASAELLRPGTHAQESEALKGSGI